MRSLLVKVRDCVQEWYDTHLRPRFRVGPPVGDWQDDLVGEESLKNLEDTQWDIRRLVSDTNNEIRAIKREHRRND
jgi:hypothetical protein